MNYGEFTSVGAGALVATISGARAFVPAPLPRDVELPLADHRLIADAREVLGRLNEAGRGLANPDLLIRPFRKQEAIMSSRIEGTQTTLEDAYVQEALGQVETASGDLLEVFNYEAALSAGVGSLADGRKISLSLTRQLHQRLLEGVRGREMNPGKFRTEQNWIGPDGCTIHEARFIPPSPEHLMPCLDQLAEYWGSKTNDDSLVRIALSHYQLESIHPFLDGNGRVGRLMIVLQMIDCGLLDKQWLFLSPYFEKNKGEYYERLYRTSSAGEYLEWIRFFARAVLGGARQTMSQLSDLKDLKDSFLDRLSGLQTQRPRQLAERLFDSPFITVPMAKRILGIPSAKLAIRRLEEVGVLKKLAWQPRGLGPGRRPDVYCATEVLDIVQRQ